MAEDKEREDLDALLKAPGWLRFVNEMQKQWTGRYDDYVAKAINGERDALQELLKLTAARTAVLAAIKYPQERLRQIDDAASARTLEMAIPLSRRGGL